MANKVPALNLNKTVFATGLALFAMFFGAGNIVFPLYLGANAGQHFWVTLIGFLLAGVGVPILGLIATSLYQGDYRAFFARLGKIPGFLIISFLMVVIGPFAAMPRTETTTYNALASFLPEFFQNNGVFSLLYCSVVFFLAYRETKVVHILGFILSPIKIISFSALVFFGLLFADAPIVNLQSQLQAFTQSVSYAYNTMDLLGTFFFCTVAFNAIANVTKAHPEVCATRLTLKAALIGGIVTSLVYLGFLVVAHNHAAALQGVPVEQTIKALSETILGKFGSVFVCISIAFACVATTLALAQVSSDFIFHSIFRKRLPRVFCLLLVMGITYVISYLGFQGILKLSLPLVNILYPALIVLCVLNILHKWKGVEMVKIPVLLTTLACAWYILY